MKKKILICGSTDFLMANFIRYVLYRDQENQYKFISFDDLDDLNDYRRVYIHKKHKFYIGNAYDKNFLKKIQYVESPDIIINNFKKIGINEVKLIDNITSIFKNCLIMQIIQKKEITNDCLYLNFVSSAIKKHNSLELHIPNCFGMRDKNSFIIKLLNNLLNNENVIYDSDKIEPWVYAEDVASRLWFLIENSQKENKINMPALGYASKNDLIKIANGELLQNKNFHQEYSNDGWCPDSNNFLEAFIKTINWYRINKWALL